MRSNVAIKSKVGGIPFGFAWLISVFLCLNARAQEAGPPMMTEDPMVADAKTWELNTSIDPAVGDHFRVTLPNLDLNYGVVKDLQVHLGVPYEVSFDHPRTTSSFGNIEVGIKFHFLHEEEHFISLGTHAIWKFTGKKMFTLPLLMHKTIGRFVIGDALTAVWSLHRGWRNGFLVGYNASDKTELMIEYFLEKLHDDVTGARGFLNAGFRYKLHDRVVLLGSFGTQVMRRPGEPREYFFSYLGVRTVF